MEPITEIWVGQAKSDDIRFRQVCMQVENRLKTSDIIYGRCPGNRCGTNDSIEMGDHEQEQIELLDVPNQTKSILETEHEQGSYKEEQIEEVKSIDEHEHVCPNCDDNSLGSYYCEACDGILCDRCYKTHSKLRTTRDHDVITIQ